MLDKKYTITDGAFYITNVCNLTCESCESYNNKKFKGHFYWHEHQEKYQQWADILHVRWLNIHGGEPFANPDLLNWAVGLKNLWNNSEKYYISTNGTLLKHNIELSKDLINRGWSISICIHDPDHRIEVETSIKEILKDRKYKIRKIERSLIYSDISTNQILITLETAFHFIKNSTNYISDSIIHMHRNNIDKAHQLCISAATDQCHFFVRGDLYKCFLTAISQDLIKQFKIEQFAQDLLNSYTPATPTDDETTLNLFFQNIEKPIKQCTLCPEREIKIQIFPLKVKKDD
jgi:organic radical activating enzyme